ncbi:ABC transporter ATP-binding protein [Nanoarchaeota archaeon]
MNFTIRHGEIISIFGPNGCGKSTLLNIMAGLDNDHTGKILFRRNTKKGFVFQDNYNSLLPWKRIVDNIQLDKKIQSAKIKKILKDLDLWNSRHKYPYQLSGGMQQLLAIARAFAHDSKIIFLDEPFSNLDYQMALKARELLLAAWQKHRPTIVFVSHDIEEAIMISDRIIVLSKRPAKIEELIEIDLPRPRQRSLVLSRKFLKYKKRLLQHIKNE